MRIVVKRPEEECSVEEYFVTDVNEQLETLQSIVGGYIECVPVGEGVLAIVDESGVLKRYKPNIQTSIHTLCGPIVFCGTDGEDLCGLDDKQIGYCRALCKIGELHYVQKGGTSGKETIR